MLADGELVANAVPFEVSVRVMIESVDEADEREVRIPVGCVSNENEAARTHSYQLQWTW